MGWKAHLFDVLSFNSRVTQKHSWILFEDKEVIQLRMSKILSMLFFRNVLDLFFAKKRLTFHFCSQILFLNLICWNKLLKLSAVMAYIHKFKASRQKKFIIPLCFVIVLAYKWETFSGDWVWICVRHNYTLPT